MNVSSENIEKKIRKEAADLPTKTLWERASLCIEAETPQPIYSKIYCSILKERDSTDERAYLGMAKCFMFMKQYEQAQREVREGKEIVARLCPSTHPTHQKSLDNYLLLHFISKVIEVREDNNNATPFRLLVLEGLRQRFKGNHSKAQKFLMKAAKSGTEEEREEAYFYTTTLFDLTNGVIENNLRRLDGPPKFFSELPEHERQYLRKVRKYILDTYLPCKTPEQIRRNFGRGNREPISSEELQEAQKLMKDIHTPADLGF